MPRKTRNTIDLSPVRNATREVANDYRRWKREIDKGRTNTDYTQRMSERVENSVIALQAAVMRCHEDGATDHQINRAVNQAVQYNREAADFLNEIFAPQD